jgi:hypothetical protein
VKFTFVTGATFTLEKARVICVRCSELTVTELELTEPVEVLVLVPLPRAASRLPSRLLVAAVPLVPVLPDPVVALLPAVPLVPALPEVAALPPVFPVLPDGLAALPPVGAAERAAGAAFVPPEFPPPVPGDAVPLLPPVPLLPAVPLEEPWASPWATLNESAAAATVARSA